MENFGYIPIERKPSDWFLSGQGDFFTPLSGNPLIFGNNWEDYLPVVEFQNNGGYDRMACVTYSILNCLEMLHIYHEKTEANFSDRYIAKLSGTTTRGNNVVAVFDTIRDKGLVRESDWPDVNTDWNGYYEDIPQNLISKGKEFIKGFEVYREFVATYNKELIFSALNFAPLQVIVKYASGNEILNPIGSYNHAVTCYGAEYGKYWLIYDHYTQTRKKYAWDYEFGCIIKPTFKPKAISMFKPQNNKLYLLVEGNEQIISMGLDGKLVIFPEKADAILNSASRSGEYQIPKPITLADYKSAEKTDAKGNPII